MKIKSGILLLCLFISTTLSYAQGVYNPVTNIPVTIQGNVLKNPWVGGFNAPIFSEVDMNGDGIKDLFVFDKDGNRYSTYLNNGTPGTVDYHYAPEYEKKFPAGMMDWVLLKDFNCDGKEDIFTYSTGAGMSVFRNDYSVQAGLKFTLEYFIVNSDYGAITANLYVARVNLPALTDIDLDGDMDVLTFPVSGNYLEYHENKGMDYFNRCDTLVYEIQQGCWGHFGLSGGSNVAILNAPCRIAPPGSDASDVRGMHNLHSGSCMIAPDLDGDLDKDLINGDVLGNNLLYLENGGDTAEALMVAQDTTFPSYDVPVNLITFPSPYYMDVDNDGNKDLVVAPCISIGQENFNNVLYYKNTTNNITNVFDYQQNRLLSEDMIEVGSGANVVFEDIDSDGLMDIIVGNFGYFNPASVADYESGISYYRNTGSATSPAFELQTDDYAGLFSLPVMGIKPAFGDIDSDGDNDMLLGIVDGNILYYTNTAGAGNVPAYTLTQANLTDAGGNAIDVGQFSTPQLADVNKDGKLDLLVGEKTGNINYYENTGTPSSHSFTFITSTFGGINVTPYLYVYGYSYPYFHDSSGVSQLLVGSVGGYIYQYNNIDGNLGGTFNLADSTYHGIYEPERISLSIADIDGDGIKEVLTGNNAGGIALYKYQSTSLPPVSEGSLNNFNLYPNPVSSQLMVKFDSQTPFERQFTIIDMPGRTIMNKLAKENIVLFDTRNLASGIYTLRVIEGNTVRSAKFIVKQ